MRHNHLPGNIPAFPAGSWSVSARCGPNGGNCVQVNLALHSAVGVRDGVVGVRDGKHPDEDGLIFGSEMWSAFLAAARVGRFDR